MRYEKGSITVFLSLVLVLVLALAGTLIEAARVRVSRGMEKRALKSAMQSVFTEYYRPLYEDYHLFLLGRDAKNKTGGSLIKEVQEYMENSLASKEETGVLIKPVDLYSIKQKNLEITDAEYIVDAHGELFLQQTAAYMKYKSTSELAEMFLEQLGVMKSTEETAKITEKKLQLEAEMGELDAEILDIIEQLEGLSCGKKGLKKLRDGRLKTEPVFAKMFSPKGINPAAAGINHSLVWESVRDKYVDPAEKLGGMEHAAGRAQSIGRQIKRLEEELEKLSENFSKIEDPKPGQIKSYEKKEEKIYKKLDKLWEEMEEYMERIDDGKQTLISQSRAIQNKIQKVLPMIEHLSEKQEILSGRLSEYQGQLKASEGRITESAYEGLMEDSQEKEAYLKKQGRKEKELSFVSRIVAMKEILEKNSGILDEFEELDQSFNFEEEEDVKRYQEIVHTIRSRLSGYEIAGLSFDYSSLSIKEQPNPLEALSDLIEGGIMSLIFEDEASMSKKEQKTADFCYQNYGGKKAVSEEDCSLEDYEGAMGKMENDGYQKELGEGFGSVGKQLEDMEDVSSMDSLLETFLLDEYILSHFKNLRMDEKLTGKKVEKADLLSEVQKKQSALSYELEYILNGEKEDGKNLESVIHKVVFIRTILNFIYLLTDSEKRGEAYQAAAALVGITGLEALVRLTQALILIAWAYGEAIVDAAFLVGGQKVPLMKTKHTFQLSFGEMFCLSRSLIKSKMENSEKTSGDRNLASLDYEGWMRIFLLLEDREKRCMRSMDIIEADMQLRNDNRFRIGNMLYGIRVKAQYQMQPRFAKLPFVAPYAAGTEEGWCFTEETCVSY